MVEVKYENFPNEMLANYFKFLIGKFFKILPISEDAPDTLKDYLDSLIIELAGSKELIAKIRYDGQFLSLLSTLQYFTDNDCEHKVYKREVFKCIRIINILQDKYELEKEEGYGD